MDLDELKRIFVETDTILLTVTAVVSVLHTIFEFLAFKNDISFWSQKDSMEGISVKSLYFQLIQSIVIFVYLVDNDTSWIILLSTAAEAVLGMWKIYMASKVVILDKFPYLKI